MAQTQYVLVYKVEETKSGSTRVTAFFDYNQCRWPPSGTPVPKPAEERKPTPCEGMAYLQNALDGKTAVVANNRLSTAERVTAEVVQIGQNEPFQLRYYVVGGEEEKDRVATVFIRDPTNSKALLSGFVDYSSATSVERMEAFFAAPTAGARLGDNRTWQRWARYSSLLVHEVTPLVRVSDPDNGATYVVLYTKVSIHPYALGWAAGGLPLGGEDTFVALCDTQDKDSWAKMLSLHRANWHSWNLICRTGGAVERIFLAGEPGSGKELWHEAIREGSAATRTTEHWATVAATMPYDQFALLLYGKREGNLEHRGFLDTCQGGGIFVDEVGKGEERIRRDLLRVLEAKEYVPVGGMPRKFKNVLFIFASTPADRRSKDGRDPVDFWTRMDIELSLPPPIRIQRSAFGRPQLSAFERARFKALFVRFWFQDKKRYATIVRLGNDREAATLPDAITALDEQVIQPISCLLAKQGFTGGRSPVSVSPRRVRSLANTLASEYQWTPSFDPQLFQGFLERQVVQFWGQVLGDAQCSP